MKLNEKYNPDSFVDFIDAFLPEDFQQREEDIIIKRDRYKEITKAKILGFCESLDLHVLEMDHTHDKDPRVAIATDAFKILADHWIHRALVIFKNNDSENYRFSYLTITLDLNDKNKVTKKYSNARRYSFYLGTDAKVKTPEQQLIKKGKIKDVDDLLNRFSVEVVNKQFYLEVAKFFDELVSTEEHNLVLPGSSEFDLNTRKSFAVRLIGRAMFCWFLKQKKSGNGQLIPDDLLSSKVVVENYYHNTLEPLFFGVLNTSIDSRDIRSELFDKVPYLNGGLFNPQYDDYYEIDRGTFTSKHINTLKISDKWFGDFFELLETYNFTIDENTVFDQELSVDPEMLGRIFENLLAEINPETGSSERKRTGSFYTPRQIVEYMVDQSLIEYFKTKTKIDENKLSAIVSYDLTDDTEYPLTVSEKQELIDAIESLKILDPACGSGAYPIGALQKIVYILQQIDPDCTLWLEKKLKGVPELYKQKIINEVKQNPFDYTRKLDVIKNSIFGVDIQPVAVDVSRLRCFLTLVVESEINDTKPNRGIEPLPNLDFKFVCANTLVSLPRSENTGLFDDHSGITALSEIMSEYFSCNSHRKNEIKIKFSNAQKDILEKTISAFGRNTGELTIKLTTWNPFSNQSNSWFDPEWMFGLEEKFDFVIGNPPYVSHDKIEKIDSLKSYSVFSAFADLYCYFFEKALELSKDDGGVMFIVSNSFIKTDYGLRLRNLLGKENSIAKVVNIEGSQIFESAIVNTAIVQSFKKGKVIVDALIVNASWNTGTFEQFVKTNSIQTHSENYSSNLWSLEDSKTQELIKKLMISGKSLEARGVFIRLGIATGANEAYLLDKEKRDHFIKLDPKNEEIIKPALRGRDINRYSLEPLQQWVILAKNGINIKNDYPVIYDYLDSFGDKFKNRGAKGQDWWNLRACAFFDDFIKPKIVWIELSDTNRFALCDDEIYLLNSAYFLLPPDDIDSKYLLGILNSSTTKFLLQKIAATSGVGTLRWINAYVKQFPIVNPTVRNSDIITRIINLVTEITSLKGENLETNTLEEEINELVMNLYDLSEIEKDIIRNS